MSTQSVWMQNQLIPDFPPLKENLKVDVCVIGGGLGGIATAYLLQKEGKKVCLLEAGQIGMGQTGRTTAQFANAMDDRYYYLEALHGIEGSKRIAESHVTAIFQTERICQVEKIECDLSRVNGYLFLSPGDTEKLIEKELLACHRAGLKNVIQIDTVPGLPFKSGTALCFPNQLQLQPLKYLGGLVSAFVRGGGQIFCNTPTETVQGGEDAFVLTQSKCKVEARSVVVATNSPINDIFSIHTKQSPYRSYVISAVIPKGSVPRALYWDTQEAYHYVRVDPHPSNPNVDLLTIGGEDHKTGQKENSDQAFENLEKWGRIHFPMMMQVEYKWSGQVMEPVDGVAFLGHNPSDKNNVYVITGDSGNGMTHCMIGAMLITDQICKRKNPWEEIYSPSRKTLRSLKTFIKENANVALQYGDWVKPGDVKALHDIKPGNGAVVREGSTLIAAYVDPSGTVNKVSAVCPHLGGIVRWNETEKTWDCPCHGSRFNPFGKVIEGPACSNLKPQN